MKLGQRCPDVKDEGTRVQWWEPLQKRRSLEVFERLHQDNATTPFSYFTLEKSPVFCVRPVNSPAMSAFDHTPTATEAECKPTVVTSNMLLSGERRSSRTTSCRAALLLLVLTMLQPLNFCGSFSTFSAPTPTTSKMFRARYPLEGGPPQVKLHVAIIVQDTWSTGKDKEQEGRLVLFDFLPAEPTAISTTLRLLTAQDVQGNLRERELRFLPPGSVCVGQSAATLEEMREFVATYPDRLSLVSNNCVSFVDAFVERYRLEHEEEGR